MSHANTPPSSLSPLASCPFPKPVLLLSCLKSLPSLVTLASAPVLAPCASSPHSQSSSLSLLPILCGGTSCILGAVHTLTWEGRGHLPKLSPMSSSADPCDDMLSSAVWLWPPFRKFLFAVAEGAPQTPFKAMAQ